MNRDQGKNQIGKYLTYEISHITLSTDSSCCSNHCQRPISTSPPEVLRPKRRLQVPSPVRRHHFTLEVAAPDLLLFVVLCRERMYTTTGTAWPRGTKVCFSSGQMACVPEIGASGGRSRITTIAKTDEGSHTYRCLSMKFMIVGIPPFCLVQLDSKLIIAAAMPHHDYGLMQRPLTVSQNFCHILSNAQRHPLNLNVLSTGVKLERNPGKLDVNATDGTAYTGNKAVTFVSLLFESIQLVRTKTLKDLTS